MKKIELALLESIINKNVDKIKSILKLAKEKNIILNINKKFENGLYAFLCSVKKNNTEIVKLLIDYSNENNLIININEKDINGDYPFIYAVYKNNIEVVKLLIDYSYKNFITLEINNKGNYGMYPLLWAIDNDNIEIVKIIINYANERNIYLNINEKEKENGYFPLLLAVIKKNKDMVKLIMNYAEKNNIVLKINEKEKENGYFPLLLAVIKKNKDMVKLIMNYAEKNNIVLKINEKDKENEYLLSWATIRNDIETIKLIIDYANRNNITLYINEKSKNGKFPFLRAVSNNNIEIAKLFIKYANKNDLFLNINDKTNNGDYPLLIATEKNNIDIVKLIFSYVKENNIILNINDKNKDGKDPIICAINNNNVEILKLITDYANEKYIILNIAKEKFCNNNEGIKNILNEYFDKLELNLKLNENYEMTLQMPSNKMGDQYEFKLSDNIFYMDSRINQCYNELLYKPNNYIYIKNPQEDNEKEDRKKYFEEIVNHKQKTEEVINEYYYEWVINKWSELNEQEYSSNFFSGGYKWKIELCTNKNDQSNDYISIYLKNIDVEREKSTHIYAKCIFCIRNCNDYSLYEIKDEISSYFSSECNSCGYSQFIKKKGLYLINENKKKSLIENDSLIISVNIRVFKYDKDEIKEIMDKKYTDIYDIMEENLYEFEINERDVMNGLYYSPEFTFAKNKWNIIFYPNGYLCNDKQKVFDLDPISSILLNLRDNDIDFSNKMLLRYFISIRNYNNYSCFISKCMKGPIYLMKYNNSCGFIEFLKKKDLYLKALTSKNSIVENNKMIIDIYIRAYKINNNTDNSSLSIGEKKDESLKTSYIDIPYKPVKENEEGDLAIVLHNFKGTNQKELDIYKGEYLRVLNWNQLEGWAFGYSSGKPERKGLFPIPFVNPYT
eukprot:jgi/Orpsp1_1/1176839/evm.model.c7180000059217.1